MFNILIDVVLRDARVIFGRRGARIVKNGVLWLLAILVFANNLALIAETAEDLRIMMGYFCRVIWKENFE